MMRLYTLLLHDWMILATPHREELVEEYIDYQEIPDLPLGVVAQTCDRPIRFKELNHFLFYSFDTL